MRLLEEGCSYRRSSDHDDHCIHVKFSFDRFAMDRLGAVQSSGVPKGSLAARRGRSDIAQFLEAS